MVFDVRRVIHHLRLHGKETTCIHQDQRMQKALDYMGRLNLVHLLAIGDSLTVQPLARARVRDVEPSEDQRLFRRDLQSFPVHVCGCALTLLVHERLEPRMATAHLLFHTRLLRALDHAPVRPRDPPRLDSHRVLPTEPLDDPRVPLLARHALAPKALDHCRHIVLELTQEENSAALGARHSLDPLRSKLLDLPVRPSEPVSRIQQNLLGVCSVFGP
mmetsp:Transcript_75241/g.213996  ORF Transcript_75241/g.213996 Transcript_75241/m.213996 type:complete len:217 (-) Transcript_75241:2267-2917(-)